ncbi:MAG: Hsp20 family protein [Eubacteriales bacterium]
MFDLIPTRPNHLFNSFFRDDFPHWADAVRSLETDIKETETGYEIHMNAPGYDKGDINITAKNDVLTVSVEKSEEKEEKNDNYVRRERCFGKQERSFSLQGIDQESIDASFENGVLKITLNKDEKYITDKKIEIK